jgi:N-dimethylarginine dimethylaminohydrolase
MERSGMREQEIGNGRFMKILMCRPDFYGIEYEINPWMDIALPVNHALAVEQWGLLVKTLQSCGAEIELIESVRGLPDLVFTANAGAIYKNKVILSHFKYPERQGETAYFKKWFEQAGLSLLNVPDKDASPFFFEGAGDALAVGDLLFAGFGFRSDQQFYAESHFFDLKKLVYCELADPYFYHLDTCFCPLNDKQALWYPKAFSPDSQKRMLAQGIELISVVEAEAKLFACNAVVLGKKIILPKGCPQITAVLEQRGFAVHSCPMNEYIKAGGACKCLTLRIGG